MSQQSNPLPIPDFDAVGLAKRLLRSIRAGALATLDRDGGFPFASLVTLATDHDGSLLLLTSRLAAHTLNLEDDARVSVLLAQSGKGDPLAHPRLTVIGRAAKLAPPEGRERFLSRHPKAKLYADFPDFSFWRIAMEAGHLNGGFARAASLSGEELRTDLSQAGALLAGEKGMLDHLNADHADVLAKMATDGSMQRKEVWTATGIDPEGIDLMAGERTARIAFPERVVDPDRLREILKRELLQR